MIDKVLSFFKYKRVFTEYDDVYRNIRLKDYGVESTDILNDNDLKALLSMDQEFLGINIPKQAVNNFKMRYFWLNLVKFNNLFIYSIAFSILFPFFIFFLPIYIPAILTGISLLLSVYFRRRYKKAFEDYDWWFSVGIRFEEMLGIEDEDN